MFGRHKFHISGVRFIAAVLLVFLCSPSSRAQDALTKLRAEYAAKNSPVDRAKVLAKLGPREINAARDLSSQAQEDKALASLSQYRDWVVATTKDLIDTGVDASRRSGGFKELQISLRTFVRKLDDLILSLPQSQRQSFREVRADFESAQNQLIDALFPKQSSRNGKRQGTK